jgi:hypothetical protein
MQTNCPTNSVHAEPEGHAPGLQRTRHNPLRQSSPLRHTASGMPVALHGSLASEISFAHAQMLPELRERHAAQLPGFIGSQPVWQIPPTHAFPPAHGLSASHAWHNCGAATGMQTRSVPASNEVHDVGSGPCGAHVVEVQLEHSPELLQHARQNELFGFAVSATHVLHG